MEAEYGPRPEVLLCRLESLSKKGMGQAGEGQTDRASHTTHLKVCWGSFFFFSSLPVEIVFDRLRSTDG